MFRIGDKKATLFPKFALFHVPSSPCSLFLHVRSSPDISSRRSLHPRVALRQVLRFSSLFRPVHTPHIWKRKKKREDEATVVKSETGDGTTVKREGDGGATVKEEEREDPFKLKMGRAPRPDEMMIDDAVRYHVLTARYCFDSSDNLFIMFQSFLDVSSDIYILLRRSSKVLLRPSSNPDHPQDHLPMLRQSSPLLWPSQAPPFPAKPQPLPSCLPSPSPVPAQLISLSHPSPHPSLSPRQPFCSPSQTPPQPVGLERWCKAPPHPHPSPTPAFPFPPPKPLLIPSLPQVRILQPENGAGGESGDEGGDVGTAPPVAAWRYGPAQLWYDMLGVSDTGENLDYGFTLKSVRGGRGGGVLARVEQFLVSIFLTFLFQLI